MTRDNNFKNNYILTQLFLRNVDQNVFFRLPNLLVIVNNIVLHQQIFDRHSIYFVINIAPFM